MQVLRPDKFVVSYCLVPGSVNLCSPLGFFSHLYCSILAAHHYLNVRLAWGKKRGKHKWWFFVLSRALKMCQRQHPCVVNRPKEVSKSHILFCCFNWVMV